MPESSLWVWRQQKDKLVEEIAHEIKLKEKNPSEDVIKATVYKILNKEIQENRVRDYEIQLGNIELIKKIIQKYKVYPKPVREYG